MRTDCECPLDHLHFGRVPGKCNRLGIILLSRPEEDGRLVLFCGPCRDNAMERGWTATRVSARPAPEPEPEPDDEPDGSYSSTAVRTISFDRARLADLIKARDRAVAQGKDQFNFDGGVLLVAYAKYLIEYLERRLQR